MLLYLFLPLVTYQYQLKDLILLLVFFKAVFHANPEAERHFAGSSLYILRHIFLKFSNTPANSNVSL